MGEMRRKFGKITLLFLGLTLVLFALYGLWVLWQQGVTTALQSGAVMVDVAGSRLLLPQLRLLYGGLAGCFSLLSIGLIGWIAWLVLAFPEKPHEADSGPK
jgi:hypothetical protein